MQNIRDIITENWKIINENVDNACVKYNMPRPEILGATKFQEMDKINIAAELGLSLIGENRVQAYLERINEYPENLTRDFIGVLQSNKIASIVGKVRYIQSCGSSQAAVQINNCAKSNSIIQEVLLQINIANEETKSGIKPEETECLLEFAANDLKNIKIAGLMVIPPPNQEEKYFEKAQILFNDFKARYELSVLSQGMSDSYVSAIKYGSTLVRIGSCLFGQRG